MSNISPDKITSRAEFSAELTRARELAGLTVRDLAHRTGIPHSTLGGYFSGGTYRRWEGRSCWRASCGVAGSARPTSRGGGVRWSACGTHPDRRPPGPRALPRTGGVPGRGRGMVLRSGRGDGRAAERGPEAGRGGRRNAPARRSVRIREVLAAAGRTGPGAGSAGDAGEGVHPGRAGAGGRAGPGRRPVRGGVRARRGRTRRRRAVRGGRRRGAGPARRLLRRGARRPPARRRAARAAGDPAADARGGDPRGGPRAAAKAGLEVDDGLVDLLLRDLGEGTCRCCRTRWRPCGRGAGGGG